MEYKQANAGTIDKVKAASWASAAAMVIMYFANRYLFMDTPLPEYIEIALELLISGGIGWLAAWAAGYYQRPKKEDTVIPDRSTTPEGDGITD